MENGTWSSHMEGLDNVTDPITILTDADLQNELSRYATTQFTFDNLPHMLVENKSDTLNHMNMHPSIHSNHHPPNLVINTMNNNGNYYKTNPPYSLMLSPMSHHQPQPQQIFPIQGPEAQYVTQSHDSSLNATTDECTKKQPAAGRRTVTPSTTRGRPRQRQRADQSPMTTTHQTISNSYNMIHEAIDDTVNNNNNDDDDTNYLISVSRDPDTLEATTEQVPAIRLSKRQRNTAASARFRIKKKQREQCLQRTACEMTNKANFMENRVHELEREVKWLKELLVTKNGCSYC
ncbi:unnamed protein product [Absidia cylindrospora]